MELMQIIPHFSENPEGKTYEEQYRLSHCEKGGGPLHETGKIARLHAHIARQRKETIYTKESRKITNFYDLVV